MRSKTTAERSAKYYRANKAKILAKQKESRDLRANRPTHPRCVKCGGVTPQNFCYKCYYRDNRELSLERQRALPVRYGFTKRAAKNRGVAFDIPIDAYIALIASPCHYCGGPLNKSGSGLDRKNNNMGYTLENAVPCCKICNVIKNQYLTHAEMCVAMDAVMLYRKKGKT